MVAAAAAAAAAVAAAAGEGRTIVSPGQASHTGLSIPVYSDNLPKTVALIRGTYFVH
jgi:hypothetical protein